MDYIVYTDESGLTAEEKYMLIGALFVPVNIHATLKNDLNHIFAQAKGSARKSRNQFLMHLIQKNDLSAIHSLLKEDKNAFEMKYGNINKTNYSAYKDFIDVLLKYPVKFATLVIDKTNGSGKFSPWDLFVNRYTMLLSSNLKRQFSEGDGFIFVCDEINTPKGSRAIFEDDLISRVHARMLAEGKVRHLHFAMTVSSHASLLSQACDLMLGAVTASLRRSQGLSIKQKKSDFSDFIKGKMGIGDLCVNVTKSSPIYFSVWHYKETN